jgi:hypothetical protein
MEFLVLGVVILVCIIISTTITNRMPNPIRARCPACASKLHLHPPGKWNLLVHVVWQAIAWAVVWRLNPPLMLGTAMVLVLAVPATHAINKTYYTIWMYWHPQRCGEGGHPVPVPTQT